MDRKRTGKKQGCFRKELRKYYLLILAAIVIIILIVIISLILSMKSEEALEEPGPDRIECPGLTEENCTKMLCHYKKAAYGPSCFMKKDSFGYKVQGITNEKDGPKIQMKTLSLETPYGMSIQNVIFKVTYLTENILRFQFKDNKKARYEVPVQEEFPLLEQRPQVNMDNLSYKFTHTNVSETFHFQVKRTDGTNLWNTQIGALMMTDQYLQIGSYLPSEYVYGLGEHVHSTLKHSMKYVSWPMFARDIPPTVEDQRNLYGVHPFYTCLEKSGKSHGVLFLNSNAMDATFLPAPAISFRTIGGILDFFIFVGDNPEHVVQLYTSLIGRPMIPPYWALGFQLSRYGYHRLKNLEDVLNRTREAKIPLAVQYLDIDHMDSNKDFTYNEVNFPGLPEFINKQKEENGLKWIIILDPALSADENYAPYSSGLKSSVFIKRHPTWKSTMFPKGLGGVNVTFGKVWPPGYVAFPDFFLNETKEWWKNLILKHRELISFDGLWIDMNEPANFETNRENPDYCETDETGGECWSLKCPNSKLEDPPYNPMLATGSSPRISEKTLCMESRQNDNSSYVHYNVHSLYGWSQTQPTLEAVQVATNSRSLVISRSTYPSSGRYAGHWLGDNESFFEDLKRSIIGMLEFNLFGIPYIGADVCGFFSDTTPDLCKRWMQLGAFYPFFRNHNGLDQKDQDPAALGPEVAAASRRAIERRITLNPFLYTLFYRAHVDGSTVVRPVFHEFSNDTETWTMDTQFMWGTALLITPITEENQKSLSIYLPKDDWWHFLGEKSWKQPYTERYVIETDADDDTPIHARGGVILPTTKYDPENYPESENSTTRDIILYVFPKEGSATGELFMDDGISKDTVENEAYALYTFSLTDCTLNISSKEYSQFSGPIPVLKKVVLFNVQEIASVSENYTFTTDEHLKSAVISVTEEMNKIEGIKWEASDGSCKMLF